MRTHRSSKGLFLPYVIRGAGDVLLGLFTVPFLGQTLHFVERSWQWTRRSALVLGVGKDAAYIADHITDAEMARREAVWIESVARPVPGWRQVREPIHAAMSHTERPSSRPM